MSHELPKKVNIFADTAKSCERISKTLEEAQDILDKAGEDVANAQAEGKSGWGHLSAAIGALRKLMRPSPDTLSWHTEIDYYLDHEPRLRWDAAGEYRTPNPALDFVLANPPMVDIPPADEPLDPNAPKMVRGWPAIFDIPELGIQWRRFYSRTFEKFVAAWRNDNDSHVYELAVYRQGFGSGWEAEATNDGGVVFTINSASKDVARRSGLAALRAHIIRGHRKTWRKVRAAEDSKRTTASAEHEEEAQA